MSIVDEAREIIVRVLDDAADRQENPASRDYLASKARKVEKAEAETIESYLVLDCVIAALRRAR